MSEPPVEYIELNMSNYGPDDVSQLNEWAIWAAGELDDLKWATSLREGKRSTYFAQVAPAWVLAMAMRFHHEGYDDESAMMEAVRRAWQTANEMVAIQENGR